MRKIISVLFSVLFVVQQHLSFAEAENSDWEDYKNILERVVTVRKFTSVDGEFYHASVDYENIKKNFELQEKIIIQLDKLKKIKPPEETKYKLAFWINAYNFFTIVDVLNNYPITSMKKIGWKNKHHDVEGILYSLDDIEHNVIRPLTDPRIHFAINCASVGCPSLSKEIFTGDQVNKQLNNAVKNALNSPLHLRLISTDSINATQIFQWFREDFDAGVYKGVLHFINKFAPERLRHASQVENNIKYDWNLNTEQNILKKMNELVTEFPELKLKMEIDAL